MTRGRREPGDLMLRVINALVAALNAASGAWNLSVGDWVTGTTQLTFAAVFIFYFRVRRTWINIGYMRGRASFFRSLDEAQRRGLSAEQWAMAEVERELGGTFLRKPEL